MPPLAALLAALVCARAGIADDVVGSSLDTDKRSIKSLGPPSLPAGCLYAGRWFARGAAVPAGEACLRCACQHGALACRRRSCAPLPDPPPPRCHVLHRKGACCPELHCPDGVILMEQEASARFESDDVIAGPTSVAHACVEGGTVYAAGSAVRSDVACEQCFCLGGARRCVRPTCLPPPPGCRPRPAPGACCPQRYYCDHRTKPPEENHPHDCKVDDKWISEGERVVSPGTQRNCTQCFCLRGSVQCQPLSCAPALLGCKPLLRQGECCAHQYHCEHSHHVPESQIGTLSSNTLTPTRIDDRAFHSSKSKKHETTTKTSLTNIFTVKNTPNYKATKNNLVSTTKVKRKTSDPPPEMSSESTKQNTTAMATSTSTTPQEPTTLAKLIATTESASSTTDLTIETTSTEQPEESVRIVINGTINCTAELSSTSLPLNFTFNETEKITSESHPRIPLIDVSNLEDHTFSANDIITDRTVNGGFDENESFVINVTSSLTTNTSRTSTRPPPPPPSPPSPTVSKISIPGIIVDALNSSKKTKGDYVHDYTEPTLPPSLPNLKIIPFVAADAVVDEEQPKESLTYPIMEREDKFPVYYHNTESKDPAYATRREDVYRPTQFPVYITDRPDHDQFPSLTAEDDFTNSGFSNIHTDLDSLVNEYTVSASLGNRAPEIKPVTQQPITTTTFKLETPAVNLFSPPVETEGGFVPKSPTGLIPEYFAVGSTPAGPAVPHLTTSMQLDMTKSECLSGDGRHVPEGETIIVACSECTCAWGELHCSPRQCRTLAGCTRRPASDNAADLCCGALICDQGNKTTGAPESPTVKPVATETIDITTKIDKTSSINPATDLPEYTTTKTEKAEITSKIQEIDIVAQNYSVPLVNTEIPKYISTTSTTTERQTTKITVTTTPTSAYTSAPPTVNQSLEYEEEEEDEGFSFGSVLKLLLSDTYESTTTTKRPPVTVRTPLPAKTVTTTRRPRPSLTPIQPPKPSIVPFVPLPVHPYIPPKNHQNPINRIDHLVLGEATAIKKTTPRPITSTIRQTETNRPTSRPFTHHVVTKITDMTKEETYTTQDAPKPPGGLPGLGPGLLKLAGCNIYGRMYRVGRIITELSTPCQECWCTEFGVQCKQLQC